MYEELVKRLREYAKEHCPLDRGSGICGCIDAREAADAIEELQQTVKHYKGCADDWYRDACDYKAICEQMKATTIVEAQHTEMYDERDKQTLMKMVKSLPLHIIPNKDEKPRWVSVTERLPEEKHAVIVWEPKYLNPYICVLSEGDWYVFGGYGVKVFGVTHWMPLPEPPKEESYGV